MYMADTFTTALAIGLAMMAALLFITNANWRGIGFASASWFAPGVQPELVAAELGQSYRVGKVVTETPVNMDLGRFDIDGRATDSALPGGVVQSGVLFGEQTLRYSIENLQTLRFTVVRTNGYAPFGIKANGNVVYEDVAELGEHTVPINLVGLVELELSTASSGWRLWSPALYELSDVVVRSAHPDITYSFAGAENLDRGELIIRFTKQSGLFTATLNGRQLQQSYESASVGRMAFGKADLQPHNTLTLHAADGAYFTGTATLSLVYRDESYEAYETTFNLTKAQIDKLPGHIIFEVPSIQHSGTVVVTLFAGNQTKLADSLDTKIGTHAVAFYKPNIVPGQPTKLVISSPDALFWIRNLKVWV
jgi:hypothetical protein